MFAFTRVKDLFQRARKSSVSEELKIKRKVKREQWFGESQLSLFLFSLKGFNRAWWNF